MDSDTLGHSLILTNLANSAWLEKVFGVVTFEPMLPRNIGAEGL
jgi:hypothetical protein